MPTETEARVLAQAIFDIRVLLSAYLGSQASGDPAVREAAHLAYALHNEALAVLEGRHFDPAEAIARVGAVDAMLGSKLAPNFQKFAGG